MNSISNAHYALVLREIARFAGLHRGTLTLPSSPTSTFQLKRLGPISTDDVLRRFEAVTGSGHGDWKSPTFSERVSVARSLADERGVVRVANVWRWKWHNYGFRDEALMWLRVIRLQVAHERRTDRARCELLIVEEPGHTLSNTVPATEWARVIQELLAVYGSLKSVVVVKELRPEPRHEPSWEINVKVLGEIAPPVALAICEHD